MRRLLALITVPALAATLVACGDDTETLSLDEYIEQGDALCAAADEEFDALGEPASEEELGSFLEDGLAIYEDLRADLGALAAPEEREEDIDALLGTLDDLIAALDGAATAAADEDEDALDEAFAELDDIDDRADELASELGFEECAVSDDEGEEAEFEETGEAIGDDDEEAVDLDAEYPPVNEVNEEDVAALVPVFSEGAGGLFTEEEAACMVRYLLARASITDFSTLPDELGEQAALECLTTARLIELGREGG